MTVRQFVNQPAEGGVGVVIVTEAIVLVIKNMTNYV